MSEKLLVKQQQLPVHDIRSYSRTCLKGSPFGHKNIVSQDICSLATGSIAPIVGICGPSKQVISQGRGILRQKDRFYCLLK